MLIKEIDKDSSIKNKYYRGKSAVLEAQMWENGIVPIKFGGDLKPH